MGSIPEAIGESRRKGLVFIVFVEGDNEGTQKMNLTWSDPKIAETLSKEKCVAIKLDHKSEDCNQFSKLYPIVCIPVTYFIGENGLPLEVVGGSLPVDEFVSKANKALEAHQKTRMNNTTSVPTAVSTVPQTSAVASSLNQCSSDSGMTQEQPAVQGRHDASSEDTIPDSLQEPSTSSSVEKKSLNERVQRAKELIEQKRQEKEEHENQEAKNKEFGRRNLGQELTKAKREREDRQAQDIVNQIKEDRAKERAHREAVRQQIARDRAEREAKRQNELKERQSSQAVAAPSAVSPGGSERQGKRDCTSVRLQFRLPDGSSITNTFPADTPLETTKQYIVTQLGSSTSPVTLYTTYPRRELTEEDLVKSLADLGLAPSSTLVVAMKSRTAITPSGSSSLPELLVWILSPLFALINFLKGFLFGSPDQPRGAYSPTSGREDSTQQSRQSNSNNSSNVRRRVPGSGTSVQEQGGIHRLHNRDDEDDDNNTWNGNSTQQM